MYDIDDMISDQEENETSGSGRKTTSEQSLDDILGGSGENWRTIEESKNDSRVPVGKVERFFGKLNVAAINLTGNIKIGDMIEITNEGESLTFRVSSMQINKEDVEEASEGDSVGIKVNRPVSPGSNVYLVG